MFMFQCFIQFTLKWIKNICHQNLFIIQRAYFSVLYPLAYITRLFCLQLEFSLARLYHVFLILENIWNSRKALIFRRDFYLSVLLKCISKYMTIVLYKEQCGAIFNPWRIISLTFIMNAGNGVQLSRRRIIFEILV